MTSWGLFFLHIDSFFWSSSSSLKIKRSMIIPLSEEDLLPRDHSFSFLRLAPWQKNGETHREHSSFLCHWHFLVPYHSLERRQRALRLRLYRYSCHICCLCMILEEGTWLHADGISAELELHRNPSYPQQCICIITLFFHLIFGKLWTIVPQDWVELLLCKNSGMEFSPLLHICLILQLPLEINIRKYTTKSPRVKATARVSCRAHHASANPAILILLLLGMRSTLILAASFQTVATYYPFLRMYLFT